MKRFDHRFFALVILLYACHEDGSSTIRTSGPVVPIGPGVPLGPHLATNLGLAARRFAGDERVLVVGVPESAQGGMDLNADGDTLDEVAVAFDLDGRTRHDLAVAFSSVSGAPLTVTLTAALVVSEAEQGQTDLN